MIYHMISTIAKVYDYIVKKGWIIISEKSDKVYWISCEEIRNMRRLRDKEVKMGQFIENEGFVILRANVDGSIYVLKDVSSLDKHIDGLVFLSTASNEFVPFSKYDAKWNLICSGIFNVSNVEVLWESDKFANLTFVNNRLFNFKKTNLKFICTITGQEFWETDIREELQIGNENDIPTAELIGIIKKRLWVSYKDSKTNWFLGIDLEMGCITFKSSLSLETGITGLKVIEDEASIFSLFGVYDPRNPISPYFEINGETGNVIRQGVIESLFQKRLLVTEWVYHEKRIYFTARREMITTNYIGVLDYV